MSIEINFTNRETYLAWRANWREIYRFQAEEIRDLKRTLKAKVGNSFAASKLQTELHYARRLANRMMETLEQAKALSKEAREAYLANRTTRDALDAAERGEVTKVENFDALIADLNQSAAA